MSSEVTALLKNGTWVLVPPNPTQHLIGCKWVYRIKRKFDGTLEHYKARLVAKGFHQEQGVDYGETFSPVVKPAAIWTVLTMAVIKAWPIKQLDVHNVFLNGHLNEEVYMHQPSGFIEEMYPHYVFRLLKSLYGLKQSRRAWYFCLHDFLLNFGFVVSKLDASLFMYNRDGVTLLLLVYVDDIILTGNTKSAL